MTQLKIVLHILIGIILGLNFYGYGNNAAATLSNAGFFIISICYIAYTAMLPAVCTFPSEVQWIKKENFNNWYKLQTYYIASFMISIPSQLIFSLSFTAISYFLSGQPLEIERLGMFVLVMLLVSLAADSYGIFFGTIFDPINGTFIGAVFTAFCLLLGGFFVQYKDMSPFFSILTYTSFYSYGWNALMQTTYGFGREKLPCPEEFCLFNSPSTIMEEFSLVDICYVQEVTNLAITICVLKVAGFFTLKKFIRSSR